MSAETGTNTSASSNVKTLTPNRATAAQVNVWWNFAATEFFRPASAKPAMTQETARSATVIVRCIFVVTDIRMPLQVRAAMMAIALPPTIVPMVQTELVCRPLAAMAIVGRESSLAMMLATPPIATPTARFLCAAIVTQMRSMVKLATKAPILKRVTATVHWWCAVMAMKTRLPQKAAMMAMV